MPAAVPSQLQHHPLRAPAYPAENDAPASDYPLESWPEWSAEEGIAAKSASRGAKFYHFDMLVEAASAGHGVALLTLPFVENDLCTGRLTLTCTTIRFGHGTYCLVQPLYTEGRTILDHFKVCCRRKRPATRSRLRRSDHRSHVIAAGEPHFRLGWRRRRFGRQNQTVFRMVGPPPEISQLQSGRNNRR